MTFSGTDTFISGYSAIENFPETSLWLLGVTELRHPGREGAHVNFPNCPFPAADTATPLAKSRRRPFVPHHM